MSAVYDVEVLADPPDMPDAHRARFKTCLERRLGSLAKDGEPAEQGQSVDVLDNFEGPFIWEMSDAEFEANPPSSVEFTLETVEAKPDGGFRVVARLSY